MKKSNSNSFNVIINGKSKRKNHMLSNSTTASSMFGLYKVCGVNKINVNQKINRTRTRTPNLDKLLTNLKKEINDVSYPLLTETKSSYTNILFNNETNDVNILKEKNSKPIVVLYAVSKVFLVALLVRQDFPTPLSPMTISLKDKS